MPTIKRSILLTLILTACATARVIAQVDIIPDVVYGHKDGLALTFDVLKPKAISNGAAVIFMVSAGWRSSYQPPQQAALRFKDLLDKGFTVIPVRHGSSPKYLIPEIVSDVRRAVRFIRYNAKQWGVDPNRLGVFGGSAGGHLSLVLGTASDDGDPNAKEDFMKASDRVASVVAYFPPVDLRPLARGVNPPSAGGAPDRYPALNFEKEKAPDYSPIVHVSSDDPPTLLIHGDKDRLVPVNNSKIIYDEMIMFSTHSDGPSISQDNGPFGLLAIAKYFSSIPQSERPRTVMFFMDNRHYMPGAERAFAQQDWLARNPSYKDKVVAVLGMEHLGQIEFREEGARLLPSGRTDLHNLWVTNNDKMVALANKAVTDNKLKGAFIRVPARNGKSGRPQGPWYGLGGLANRINKPGFSIMGSMGAYWATSSRLDRFDAEHFCRQVATFTQLTGELMLADMKELQSAPSDRTVMPRVSEGGVPPGANISASPANNLAPATRTAAGTAPAASAGFQQLMKDRLPSDFIQDRFYSFKEAGGLWMPYSLFAPRDYDKSKKYPLIVMLHGLNITAVQQIRFEGVAELAEIYGYIVVCPTGYSA